MTEIVFNVDGEDVKIEAELVLRIRRNSEHSSTIFREGEEPLHVNEPFDSVYSKISGVISEW